MTTARHAATPPMRRTLVRIAGFAALAAVLALALAAWRSQGDAAPGGVIEDDRVVAVLQAPGAAYPAALRDDLRRTRAAPDDPGAAKRAARGLIDEGRAAGDARLVGAGLGILRPALVRNDPEALALAATARQYQHDFTGALALLDEAIGLAPNDAGSIIMRATIRTVLGEFDRAQDDCRRLAALRRIDLALLCQASALALSAEAPAVYARLEGILALGGVFSPDLEPYAIGLLGEIAMLQGWTNVARGHFATALARDPGAVRVRMMLADSLLADGDYRDAMAALDGAPDVDGVLLRRAIAATGFGDDTAAQAARAELDRRFRLNLDLGLGAHAREEARYFLEVAPDAALALTRAQVNWSLQHELEDAQLLLDAAAAAGEPAAAAPVLAWIDEAAVSVPTLRIPDAVREAAP